MSTHTKGEWKVTTFNGDTTRFRRDTGLCAGMTYINLFKHKEGLVATIHKNMAGFTPEEIKKSKLSWQTQGRVGHPTDRVFKQMIRDKDIKNNPIQIDDVNRAYALYGANVNILKGAATRDKSHGVVGGRCEILRDFTNYTNLLRCLRMQPCMYSENNLRFLLLSEY